MRLHEWVPAVGEAVGLSDLAVTKRLGGSWGRTEAVGAESAVTIGSRSSSCVQRDNRSTPVGDHYTSPAAWKKRCTQFIAKTSRRCARPQVPTGTGT